MIQKPTKGNIPSTLIKHPKQIIIVTTLLDSKVYTKAKLAQLYQWRWQVEVDLRHVKTTLGMEMLPGKTPVMVREEI